MGRPKLDDAKRVHIPLKVSDRMAARIDGARGEQSRAEWVRALITRELEDQAPGERAPERARQRPAERPAARLARSPVPAAAKPAAADSGPAGGHSGHLVEPAWGSSKSGRYFCQTCKASGAAPKGWVDGPKA